MARLARKMITTLMLVALASSGFAAELEIRIGSLPGASTGDAVVWAVPVGRSVPPPPADVRAVMDQNNRMFIPHVLPIQRGTPVEFPNSDNIQHQVYSFSKPKVFQLPLYRGRTQNPVIFDKAGLVSLGCNIHDQMSAWIVVVDTPWFASTTAGGTVTFEDLEEGSYDVMLWYPGIRSAVAAKRVELDSSRSVVTLDSSADRAP